MEQLRVCVGTSCHLNGANNIVMSFRHLIEEYDLHDKVELSAMFCARTCSNKDVAVWFCDKAYRVTAAEARQFFLSTVVPAIQK